MHYRIDGKVLSPEDAEREVARLRALPDAEIRALHNAGAMGAWNIAIGGDPERVADGWKAPVLTPPAGASLEVKEAIVALDRTLQAPLVPVFDKAGDVVAIQRVLDTPPKPSEPGRSAAPAAAAPDTKSYTIKRVIEVLMRVLPGRFRKLDERIALLEGRMGVVANLDAISRRLGELEARQSGLSYRGTWKATTEYKRGDFVTHSGSLWHCWEPCADAPGTTSSWQLAVKAGRDAR